jgi:GntR family transcriptional regulator
MSEPRYERIARDLRRKIERHELKPGDRLPTEKTIQTDYDVSVTVARTALAQLRAEGLIVSEQGRGSFVREPRALLRLSTRRYRRGAGVEPPFKTETAASGLDSAVRYENAQVQASAEVAKRLHIDEGDPVTETRYRFFADGDPVQMSTQWEPLALTSGTPIEVPETGPVGKQGVIARFDSIGIHVTEVHEAIRASMPTPDEARELSIGPGTPVFRITRTHWAGDRPVETADITVPADRYVVEHTQQVSLTDDGDES